MNISYRVLSMNSGFGAAAWSDRSAVASQDRQAIAAVPPAVRRVLRRSYPAGRPGYVCRMDVFLPNFPARVRPALSAAPGLFGGVPIFPSRASGDPAPVRSTGTFLPQLPRLLALASTSIGSAGAF
jgi:hypothetical protein